MPVNIGVSYSEKALRMSRYIALLRAVNVGGTGKLPMADLTTMCEEIGFGRVRTYIASGNVLFDTRLSAAKAKAALEARLAAYAGKPVGVVIRTAAEMAAVLAHNPFDDAPANRVVAIFVDDVLSAEAIAQATGRRQERIALGVEVTAARELYVHYGDGMADSKLRIPAAKMGTARNMNTVAKLVELAAA
jgi:uncharacterized protein (DUF1697 family)